MTYTIIGIGILFIAIGYLVTEKNAKYLLSGYNTMSKPEQEQVLIKPYIKNFKKFHIFLGLSFIVIGLVLHYINRNLSAIFLGIYPLVAYGYFVWESRKFFKEVKSNNNKTKFGLIVVLGSLLFVMAIFFMGNKEDQLLFEKEKVIIEGFYGEEIDVGEIEGIELVDRLPNIESRSNGYAAGSVRKGYFKTGSNSTVKLILNSDKTPYIFITTKGKRKIYYSSGKRPNQEIFQLLKKHLNSNSKNTVPF